jgi:hypothetical protein
MRATDEVDGEASMASRSVLGGFARIGLITRHAVVDGAGRGVGYMVSEVDAVDSAPPNPLDRSSGWSFTTTFLTAGLEAARSWEPALLGRGTAEFMRLFLSDPASRA